MSVASFSQVQENPELAVRSVGETKKHRQIKLRAGEWLIKKGFLPSKIFVEYPLKIAGRKYSVDVIGKEKNNPIIIECGLCDSYKLRHLKSKFNRVYLWKFNRSKPTRITKQFLTEIHYRERWTG